MGIQTPKILSLGYIKLFDRYDIDGILCMWIIGVGSLRMEVCVSVWVF